jgi:hypothetical protein
LIQRYLRTGAELERLMHTVAAIVVRLSRSNGPRTGTTKSTNNHRPTTNKHDCPWYACRICGDSSGKEYPPMNNPVPYNDAQHLAELKARRRALEQRLDALRLLPDNEWIRDLIRIDEGRVSSLDEKIRIFNAEAPPDF